MEGNLIVLNMPEVVRDLWRAQQVLMEHYADTKLRFTLDGRLVGDIAEAIALEHFDLVLPVKRTGGVDAMTRLGKSVQVKATGKLGCGPAFSSGKGTAEHLLFFQINFELATASVLYNGPEAPIRALLPSVWSGTVVIPLAAIKELARTVPSSHMLPLKSG